MDKKDLKPTLINGTRDDIAPGLSRRSFFMAAGAAGVGTAARTMLLPNKAAPAAIPIFRVTSRRVMRFCLLMQGLPWSATILS